MPGPAQIRHALMSVSDKAGLADFARGLTALGVAIYSTGGTRRFLEEQGLKVRDIAAYTGFPEMMDGRVKTLHPKIFAGILCRRDCPDDMAALEDQEIVPFDLVVVNLYPFRETVARPDVTREEAIEQIDIGGPSLVRAAAKNHVFVAVATSPAQYAELLAEIRKTGSVSDELRQRLAAEAFDHTAAYDQAIAAYFAKVSGGSPLTPPCQGGESWPARMELSLELHQALRYGENPHQAAALYKLPGWPGVSLVPSPLYQGGAGGACRQLHGKELSYNNLLDLDSALSIVQMLSQPAVAVIKHNNPCGAATADVLADATRAALDGDPVSAFGSVLGLNRTVDAATAEVLTEPDRFIEAIVAPSFEPVAVEILTTRPKWKANVRLLEVGSLHPGIPPLTKGGQGEVAALHYRSVAGGMLVQQADTAVDDESQWQVVTTAQPPEELRRDLSFAWAIVRHVKSNAIVLCRGGALIGVGAGQMSRVDSVQIAIRKAGPGAADSVLASDAFFPFPDSIHEAAAAGIAAIIQPGGSRRDDEVIAACNEHGLPMLFTSRRHFRH